MAKEVIVATAPHEGLQLAERYRPDLILLDITMPDMDGFEVLDRLKRNWHTMAAPVLMLTGRIDEESKRRAANLCGNDFIEKPVGLKILISRIEKAVSESGER